VFFPRHRGITHGIGLKASNWRYWWKVEVFQDRQEVEAEVRETNPRPRPDGSDIKKLREDGVPGVVDALVRAFRDDPMMSWVFPDGTRRRRQLERSFRLYLRRIWLPQDECYTTDRLTGAALWMPPGTWDLAPLEQLRLFPSTVAIAGRDLPRLIRTLTAIESSHPREPHYYLAVLGVEPGSQGRGFGAALIGPVLDTCDRERVPAYLEASTPRNRALYERNGFQTVEELRVAKDAPPLWRMWREPGAT
jgi:GNAT superfamily N-acetyltransferase